MDSKDLQVGQRVSVLVCGTVQRTVPGKRSTFVTLGFSCFPLLMVAGEKPSTVVGKEATVTVCGTVSKVGRRGGLLLRGRTVAPFWATIARSEVVSIEVEAR